MVRFLRSSPHFKTVVTSRFETVPGAGPYSPQFKTICTSPVGVTPGKPPPTRPGHGPFCPPSSALGPIHLSTAARLPNGHRLESLSLLSGPPHPPKDRKVLGYEAGQSHPRGRSADSIARTHSHPPLEGKVLGYEAGQSHPRGSHTHQSLVGWHLMPLPRSFPDRRTLPVTIRTRPVGCYGRMGSWVATNRSRRRSVWFNGYANDWR